MSNLNAKLEQAFALLDSKDAGGAMAIGREILAAQPGHVQALRVMAKAALQERRPQDGERYVREALEVDPECVQCWNEYGAILATQRRYYEAISAFFRALDIDSSYSFAHINLGNCYRRIGDYASAADHFRRAADLDPGKVETRLKLGQSLYDAGRYKQAVSVYRQLLEEKPDVPVIHFRLGEAYVRQGASERALEHLQKAIALEPGFTHAHTLLGRLYQALGDTERAVACYRRCLELDPENADGYLQLAEITKHTEIDNDMRAMERLAASEKIEPKKRMALEFGLGKAYEDLQDFDRAFDHYAAANRILRSTYDYSVDEFQRYVQRVVSVFDNELIERLAGAGLRDKTPIFVLGMPRSGTTLVEQILSSHPTVFGAGEMDFIQQMSHELRKTNAAGQVIEYPELLHTLDRKDLAILGKTYIDNLRSLSRDAARIVDKMPHNFNYIGLIRLALPDAKVVHCRRDPVDTCLSCFKTFFWGSHKYAQDLAELGQYYRLYERLMAFWRKTFPGDIYEVCYESLVNDPAKEIEALLAFCDLDWNEACLQPHKSPRPVLTKSQGQVRRPIYKDAIRYWERYAHRLQPLLKALKDS